MLPEPAQVPHRKGRQPRKGCFFTLLLIAGLLLILAGLLLLGIAGVGFVVMLVRVGPDLGDALQHLDQQMAGFIFILLLVNLLIFPLAGLVGAAIAGLGMALSYIGTEPGASPPAIPPASERASQFHPQS